MFRASRPPLEGGFAAFREYVLRDFTRIQNAFSKSAAVEEGVFTPTFDFATTGDLSNSYVDQQGRYWLVGPLCYVQGFVSVTPTFTTSSGEVRVGGLPYPHSSLAPRATLLLRISGSGVSRSGRTADLGEVTESTSYFRLISTGESLGAQILNNTHVTTATALNIRFSGFYPIK